MLGEDGASLKQQLDCADQYGPHSDRGLEGIAIADRDSFRNVTFSPVKKEMQSLSGAAARAAVHEQLKTPLVVCASASSTGQQTSFCLF